MSFSDAMKAIGKGIGNAVLDSLESDCNRYSKDKRFSDEQRSAYRDFGDFIDNARNGNFSSYEDDDE